MRILLHFDFAPGDTWALTRLVHDFSVQYPEHELYCATSHNYGVFFNSPYHRIHALPSGWRPDAEFTFRFDEPPAGVRRRYGNASPDKSMVGAFYESFAAWGFPLRMECPSPEWFPTDFEENYSLVPTDRPYCVLNAGFKWDNPSKFWGREKFQSVVSALRDRVLFVQVGSLDPLLGSHGAIAGALNLLGKTSLRDLAHLVYHADFVLTGVSQLHHLSGIQCYKPRRCITIAGAREPVNWANCHRREGVTWCWHGNNESFSECMEAGCRVGAGCWHSVCPRSRLSPSPCMDSILPESVICDFEESLNGK